MWRRLWTTGRTYVRLGTSSILPCFPSLEQIGGYFSALADEIIRVEMENQLISIYQGVDRLEGGLMAILLLRC